MCVRQHITYSCSHEETTSLEPCALWWDCGDCAGDRTVPIDANYPCLRCQAVGASNEEQEDLSSYNEQGESRGILSYQLSDGETWYIISQDDLSGYSIELQKDTNVQDSKKERKCLQWADYMGEKLVSFRLFFPSYRLLTSCDDSPCENSPTNSTSQWAD